MASNELTFVRPSSVERSPATSRQVRALGNQLQRLQAKTILRGGAVRSESMVAQEKLRELDRLTREAMLGQSMLRKWADTFAGSDPMLHDDLMMFSEMARMGKGQILSDLLDTYSREGYGV